MGTGPAVAISLVGGLAATVLLIGGTLGVLYVVNHQTCTVQLAGTELQITAEGRDANKSCDDLVAARGPAGPGGGGSYYRVDKPDGTIMCWTTYQGIKYTVRDKGMLKINGSGVCQALFTPRRSS
jgi:hypothetical protein